MWCFAVYLWIKHAGPPGHKIDCVEGGFLRHRRSLKELFRSERSQIFAKMTWATHWTSIKQSIGPCQTVKLSMPVLCCATPFSPGLEQIDLVPWGDSVGSWKFLRHGKATDEPRIRVARDDVDVSQCFIWGQDECSNLHFQGTWAPFSAPFRPLFGPSWSLLWLKMWFQLTRKTGHENRAGSLPTQRKWHRYLLRLVQMQCLWSFCKAMLWDLWAPPEMLSSSDSFLCLPSLPSGKNTSFKVCPGFKVSSLDLRVFQCEMEPPAAFVPPSHQQYLRLDLSKRKWSSWHPK